MTKWLDFGSQNMANSRKTGTCPIEESPYENSLDLDRRRCSGADDNVRDAEYTIWILPASGGQLCAQLVTLSVSIFA